MFKAATLKPTLCRRSLPIVAVASLLALAGCGGTVNRGLESVHQPVVSRSDYLIDLGTAGGRLAAGEAQRLAAWLDAMHLDYGDRVAIERATNDGLGSDGPPIHDAIAAAVANYGLLLSDAAPVSATPVPAGAVRVVVSRLRAGVPGCPDWSRDSSIDYDQNTSSNYGCATGVNLAAMVANPQDLIRGNATHDLTDQTVNSRAIGSFRRAAPTGAGGVNVGAAGATSAGGK